MCDFHMLGAEEILGVVPVVKGQLLHTAQLIWWVQIVPCLVASELQELAEATVLAK